MADPYDVLKVTDRPVENVRVDSTPPPSWKPRVTLRTLIVFGLLMLVLLGYYGYATFRILSFSSAALNASPSYCPLNVWSNLTTSAALFSYIYLHPLNNFTNYALYSASECYIIENATGGLYTQSIINQSIVASATTTIQQGGMVG